MRVADAPSGWRVVKRCDDGGTIFRPANEPANTTHRPSKHRTSKPPKHPKSLTTYATACEAVESLERTLGKRTQQWTYRDSNGDPVGLAVRFAVPDGEKTFRPVSRVGGRWVCCAVKEPRPIYNLRAILHSSADETIFIVEGEKCCDVATDIGFLATTSAGGSNAANKTNWAALAGHNVVILPDNDTPGEHYVDDVVRLVRAAGAASVKIVRLCEVWPDMPDDGDLYDMAFDAESPWAGWEDEDIRSAIHRLSDKAEPINADEADDTDDESEPFPRDGFPPALAPMRDYFDAVAEAMQVPPEAVALLGMAIATTGVLKKAEVDCGGWREPAPLWALALLPSGERKSAVLRELTTPIAQWERDEAKRLAPDIARQTEAGLIAQKRLDSLRKKAVENGCDDEALTLAEAIADEKPIVAPRLLVGEATPEALAVSMERNGERAIVTAAEGDAIDIILGRYSSRPNLGVFLAGHSGDSINCLRIGRESVSMQRPALALAMIVQPEAMSDCYESRAARGRGFLARFLGCAPKTRLGERAIRPEPVPDELRERAWSSPMRVMLEWPHPDEGPIVARFDAAGQRLFDAFRTELEPRLHPIYGDLGATDSVRAWASKLPGALARLALSMECFARSLERWAAPPAIIRAETVRAALAWSPWLIDANSRAEAIALAEGADDDDGPAGLTPAQRELVTWIRKHDGRTTARELAQGPSRYRGKGGMNRAETSLRDLAQAGVGEIKYKRNSAGGPGVDVFILNTAGGCYGYTTPIGGAESEGSVAVAGGLGVKNNDAGTGEVSP